MKIKSIKLALLVLIASATALQASSGYYFDSSIHSSDLFSNTPERRGLIGFNDILNSKPRTYQLYQLNQKSDDSFAKKTVQFNKYFHKIFPTKDGKLTLIPHILLSSRLHKHIKLGDKYLYLYWENPNKGHAVFPLTEDVEKKIKSTSNNETLWITLVKYKKGSDKGLYKIFNSNLDLTGSIDIFFGKVDDPFTHKQSTEIDKTGDLPKGNKRVSFNIRGYLGSSLVTIVKGNHQRRSENSYPKQKGPMGALSMYLKDNLYWSRHPHIRIIGAGLSADSKFFRSSVKGESSRQFGAKDENLFAKNIIEVPPAIQEALKTQDKVNAVIQLYGEKNKESGKYKIIVPHNGINDHVGSFDILLADDQPETNDKPSEPEALTLEEEPAGGSPHTWAPGIEKDFAIFKEEVMSEIANLKKMVNHLMEKMNK